MLTAMTPEGVVTMLDEKDLCQVIDKYISREVAEYVADRISEVNIAEYKAELEVQTDLRNYEQSCENWHTLVQDKSEELEEIIQYMEESKRIDKQKIYDKLVRIVVDMRGEL